MNERELGLLTEISGALVDIAGSIDKIKPSDAEPVEPPKVTVAVQPTPVPVHVHVPKADEWSEMRIKIVKGADGSKEYVITKT